MVPIMMKKMRTKIPRKILRTRTRILKKILRKILGIKMKAPIIKLKILTESDQVNQKIFFMAFGGDGFSFL